MIDMIMIARNYPIFYKYIAPIKDIKTFYQQFCQMPYMVEFGL